MTQPLPVLLEFVRELRAAGLSPGTDRVAVAAQALGMLPDRPYWALRLTLCARPSDFPIFDSVWYASSPAEPDPAEVEAHAGQAIEPEPDGATTSEPDGADRDGGSARAGATGGDQLRRKDLRDLTPQELAEVARLIALLAPAARRRPVMRREPRRTGRIDQARTVRLMLRGGGEPSRIPRSRRALRPRRLLLLIDISGSMADYSGAYLRFAHAAVTAGPATTEVFTIGTKWTRLTPLLAGRNADAAMRAIAGLESDWDDGTTLGPAMRDFLRSWGGRRCVRGAIVVICSDGLEAGTGDVLPRQVARLSRLGHILVWVNPLRAVRNYRPRGALRKSLEHADAHLHGHDFASLCALAEVIAR